MAPELETDTEKITPEMIRNACKTAIEQLVDRFNARHQAQVACDTAPASIDGADVQVDGGHVHGAYDITIQVEEV